MVREEAFQLPVGAVLGQAPIPATHQGEALALQPPPCMNPRPCTLHGDRGTALQLSFHPPGDPYYLCDQSWAGPGVCDFSCGRCTYCPVFQDPFCQVNIQVRIIGHASCQCCALYPALADPFCQVTLSYHCCHTTVPLVPMPARCCPHKTTRHVLLGSPEFIHAVMQCRSAQSGNRAAGTAPSCRCT